MKQGYFAKKIGSNWSFLVEMVIQRFCRAYMESPPPAVFHYKYQSYKYERNTAGKSARVNPCSKILEQILYDLKGILAA